MDFNASLRKAVKTGTVFLGRNKTQECIEEGKARLVVVAKNSPESVKNLVKEIDIPVYIYEGSSVQLGKACGMPYVVSALAVIEPGESDILNVARV
ncbi:50S ribosomal protein L30e [Methanoculleus bourgensis]|jgi:large subunit ribosomal protein L30e|uniref:Large ribosomal subunit protein eL30 n=1 Tax=Methanoculleus bourgensis TaxID=83986 RepID=A0A0X3BHP4_9EURY|nr:MULTISPECIES: 50S ribosomal protein L30e [Methanoculleus]MBT0731823.1 50S ribosomal protein L30e [Methanoculleus bourgensis]MDD3372070.1 50S ribosomal protein L30e [Methanoculleus bourgensis]NMA87574.1 50S ribosomal protein L30e [Methanoculleus bourgensis]CVK31451.1 50S ribosomal protein L30e [Methanoculleus bourgensis]SAI87131.1 large subunit ribosomal protein L30e [Methanoculleus bourgensis]